MRYKLGVYWNRASGRGRLPVYVPSTGLEYTILTTTSAETYTTNHETSSTGSMLVSWGDGSADEVIGVSTTPSHEYATAGTYAVNIKEFLVSTLSFSNDGNVVDVVTAIPSAFTFDTTCDPYQMFYRSTVESVPSKFFYDVSDKMEIYLYSGRYYMSFYRMFLDSNLDTMPSDFLEMDYSQFSNAVDHVNASSMFSATSLTAVSDGMFDSFPDAYYFELSSMLDSCFDLVSCGRLIPTASTGLVILADSIFSDCEVLTTVNSRIFQNITHITIDSSFDSAFAYCYDLASISNEILYNCTSSIDVQFMFNYCTSLQYPTGLLDSLSIDSLDYTFSDCTGITNAVDDLWNDYPSVRHTNCFENCTSASNYASIPTDWK